MQEWSLVYRRQCAARMTSAAGKTPRMGFMGNLRPGQRGWEVLVYRCGGGGGDVFLRMALCTGKIYGQKRKEKAENTQNV